MNIILFDDPDIRKNLLPLTFTRPAAGMRVGIMTIAEKWARRLNTQPSFATADYLSSKYRQHTTADNLWIQGALCPDDDLVAAILRLQPGEALCQGATLLAVRTPQAEWPEKAAQRVVSYAGAVTLIDRPWKIFQVNGQQIRLDYTLLTAGRTSAAIADPHTRVYRPENIFLEEGVVIHAAILNAENGPIYLGKNAQVQEGAIVRGPFALGEGAVINMGGKMRADTTVGPFCKIGGEVSNAVLFGYSNKAHDGFLGNSVLGEWCNLGADTNTSNLKNNYDEVKLWSYAGNGLIKTGIPNCGLIMGDHSKSGINTMFNTGTVVGVSANVFGGGFPPKHVPSFRWGGADGLAIYQFDKAMATASRVLARRAIVLDEMDQMILQNIFQQAT